MDQQTKDGGGKNDEMDREAKEGSEKDEMDQEAKEGGEKNDERVGM